MEELNEKNKKVLVALLAISMVILSLVGCTSSTSSDPEEENATPVEELQEEVGSMKPGIYTSSANGYSPASPVEVKVTVSEDSIRDIEVSEDNYETGPLFKTALKIVPRIIENQSVNVDVISGATSTSFAIKTAVKDAIVQALVANGSDEGDVSKFQINPQYKDDLVTLETDVLVVGMGASGISAAMRTAETISDAGEEVNVLAIDKAGLFGGTSTTTTEMFAVNPVRHQEKFRNGEEYMDKEGMRQAWYDYSLGDAKEELVDYMIDESGNTLDWLEFEHGYQFSSDPLQGFTGSDFYACKFQFLPNNTGNNKDIVHDYFKGIVSNFEDLGGEYMLETEAYDIIYDEESNLVQGVKARGYDGTEYEIYAKAVISATGGFAGSGEMMTELLSDEYYPIKGSWAVKGFTGNDGKMIQAAMDIGAGTYNIGTPPIVHLTGVPITLTQFDTHIVEDKIGTATNKTAMWSENDVPKYMVINPYSLAVSKNGDRFATEEQIGFLDSWKAGPSFFSIYSNDHVQDIKENGFDAASLTGPSLAWLGYQCAVPAEGVSFDKIMQQPMDKRYLTCMPDGTPITEIEDILDAGIEAGFIYKADTLEELAEVTGMDPNTLITTVETYNEYCSTGEDEEFGKQETYLRGIGEGPYYAVTGCAYTYASSGGLDVDEYFRVLQDDHETPIKGLYAIGGDNSGVLYTEKKPYVTFGGGAQGWAYTSGYVCGKYVGEYMLNLDE